MSDHKFMKTLKGKVFDFDRPEEHEFDAEEIAHSLSMQCRYNGHVCRFYSVAEHACRVADYLAENYIDIGSGVLWRSPMPTRYMHRGEPPWKLALAGLHHDSVESFTGDQVTPVKTIVPEFTYLEDRVSAAVFKWLGLEYPYPSVVHSIDRRISVDERLALRPGWRAHWQEHVFDYPTPLDVDVEGWAPEFARDQFLARHEAYGGP